MTKIEIQKQIIDKIVKYLSSLGSDMYYSPTVDICYEVKSIIKSKKLLSSEETDFVSNLKPHDIQSLMSYNSSCC